MTTLSPRLQGALEELLKLLYFAQQETALSMDLLGPRVKKFNRGELPSKELFFWIKSCIRAFLSQVDGLGFAMRRAVVTAADEVGLDIPRKKLAELAERKYDAEQDAVSTEAARSLSTADSLKLGLRYFPALFSVDTFVDFKNPGWHCLITLIAARNDFAHPKRLEHLRPLAAATHLQPAMVWFFAAMGDVFAAVAGKVVRAVKSQSIRASSVPRIVAPRLPSSPTILDQPFYDEVETNPSVTIRYAQAMLSELGDDTARAVTLVNDTLPEVVAAKIDPARHFKYQFAMRNLLRTLYSEAEGIVGYLEYVLTLAGRRGDARLTPLELATMQAGEVEDRLVAAVNLWSREFGDRRVVARSGKGWKALVLARQWRNQATHPKTGLDFFLLPSHLPYVLAAASWFASEVRPALRA